MRVLVVLALLLAACGGSEAQVKEDVSDWWLIEIHDESPVFYTYTGHLTQIDDKVQGFVLLSKGEVDFTGHYLNSETLHLEGHSTVYGPMFLNVRFSDVDNFAGLFLCKGFPINVSMVGKRAHNFWDSSKPQKSAVSLPNGVGAAEPNVAYYCK